VYFIRARGRVLYAGITTDIERRLRAHRSGRGAKYLRGRGSLRLVFSRKLGEHGLALRVERQLKRLHKTEKEALVRAAPSRARLLRLLALPF
jgi:putative endonuclease